MKQSTLHDVISSWPVTFVVLVLALAVLSLLAQVQPEPHYHVAWLKPCETCEAVPHSVYKSLEEAQTKAPKGAIIKSLD